MTVVWTRASKEVVEMADQLICTHHEHLMDQVVGLLFRSERSTSGGQEILGQTSKVSDKMNALLPQEEQMDFLIWIARDWWYAASQEQKKALLDHELCHCGPEGKMRPHEVEEFVEIIERHGLWHRSLKRFADGAVQHTIPGLADHLARSGAVLSVNPDRMSVPQEA